jgi:hypothetical protein
MTYSIETDALHMSIEGIGCHPLNIGNLRLTLAIPDTPRVESSVHQGTGHAVSLKMTPFLRGHHYLTTSIASKQVYMYIVVRRPLVYLRLTPVHGEESRSTDMFDWTTVTCAAYKLKET